MVKAKFPGRCPACRGGWRKGTWITMREDEWVHRVCAEGERPAPKWTRANTEEAKAYLAADARGEEQLPRRRGAWTAAASPPSPAPPDAGTAVRGSTAGSGRTASGGGTGQGTRARFAATCSLCGQEITVGAPASKWNGVWAHTPCATARRATAAIERGETYRGHKPSEWKRGKRPESSH